MAVQIRVIRNSLPGLAGKIHGKAGLTAQRSAERVRDRAKALVLVDTGETRDSIQTAKRDDYGRVVSSSRPSTDGSFDLPSHLEFKVHPYLRPALEEERGTFLGAIAHIMDGLV